MILPKEIDMVEVGPRDGFQNVKTFIPTDIKIKIIEDLIDSGVKAMEVTSFVHPKAIPQMSDAFEVASYIAKKHSNSIRLIALVPNIKGAENALKAGINEVTYVISVSERHNKENINRHPDESLEDLKKLIKTYPELKVRLSAATSFGCPFLGKISEDKVAELVQKAIYNGIREVTLCDTIGIANPKQVESVIKKIKPVAKDIKLGLHFHDTRGMGLANTLTGLNNDITTYETSIGGLGGCPFAPGAAGNTASEDMINMIHEMNIETGVDLQKFIKISNFIKNNIDYPLTSHLINACKIDPDK